MDRWDNFERFFSSGNFSRTLSNTLKIGFVTFLTFPADPAGAAA